MHQLVKHSTTVRSAHIVFMCFVFIWEQTATCAPYSINWLVFISEKKSVYSAVRTGSLNKAVCVSSLKGIIYLILWEKKCLNLLPGKVQTYKSPTKRKTRKCISNIVWWIDVSGKCGVSETPVSIYLSTDYHSRNLQSSFAPCWEQQNSQI